MRGGVSVFSFITSIRSERPFNPPLGHPVSKTCPATYVLHTQLHTFLIGARRSRNVITAYSIYNGTTGQGCCHGRLLGACSGCQRAARLDGLFCIQRLCDRWAERVLSLCDVSTCGIRDCCGAVVREPGGPLSQATWADIV